MTEIFCTYATQKFLNIFFSQDFDLKTGLANAWLSEDVEQGLIDSISLIPVSRLPINSLNIDDEILLAGSDNESVYCIRNIFL